jgi:hypothetical protein
MNLPTATRPSSPAQNHTLYVHERWDETIIPALTDYITIPAKSPTFDADWEAQKVKSLKLEVLRLPGRTPLLFFEVASTHSSDTVPLKTPAPCCCMGIWTNNPSSMAGAMASRRGLPDCKTK